MARKRTIHPGAPTDEAVASCSVYARLLWAYLPCHADKLGRLEDKPFSLKLAILPTDQVDMDGLLAELAAPKTRSGVPLQPLIERYVGPDGRRYVQIRTFLRHQAPHPREAASVIPPPPRPGPSPAEVDPSHAKVDLGTPRADLGAAQPDLFAASPSDPGPVPEGSRAFQISSLPLLEPDPDPERAIPVPPPTVHHAVVRALAPGSLIVPNPARDGPAPVGGIDPRNLRYRSPAPPAPAAPGRDPPGLRAQRLVDMFGRVRSEVGQAHGRGAVPWHHGSKDFARAVEFVERLDREGQEPVSVSEVERTMRAHLEWAVRQPERKHFEVGWAFACWDRRFDDWLEEVRGLRQPELPGLTDRERENLRNSQLWLRMKEQEEEVSR